MAEFDPEEEKPNIDNIDEFLKQINQRAGNLENLENSKAEDAKARENIQKGEDVVPTYPITVTIRDAMNGFVITTGNRFFPSVGREFVTLTLDEAFLLIREAYAEQVPPEAL